METCCTCHQLIYQVTVTCKKKKRNRLITYFPLFTTVNSLCFSCFSFINNIPSYLSKKKKERQRKSLLLKTLHYISGRPKASVDCIQAEYEFKGRVRGKKRFNYGDINSSLELVDAGSLRIQH